MQMDRQGRKREHQCEGAQQPQPLSKCHGLSTNAKKRVKQRSRDERVVPRDKPVSWPVNSMKRHISNGGRCHLCPVGGFEISPVPVLRENSTYKLSPEGTAENVQGLQSWADSEFSPRVVSPLAIPALASCDVLSRPSRHWSWMSSLHRTSVPGYSQPSLRDSVCKSSSHADSLAPAYPARSRLFPRPENRKDEVAGLCSHEEEDRALPQTRARPFLSNELQPLVTRPAGE